MKALPLIIASTLVVAALGIGAFLLTQNNSVSTPTTSQNQKEVSDNNGTSQEATQTSSRYIEYSKENLEAKSSTRRVLFFYANWCPTCRPADTDLKAKQDQIPEDVTVIRVNYNDSETDEEEKALASKYGVTYQHTYVQIDGNGAEVAKWNGGAIAQLLTNLK